MQTVLLTLTGLIIPTRQPADVTPARLRQELERIENLRLLHWYAIQEVHDARALALYLTGWGGSEHGVEVEDLMRESEALYGLLRSIEHGGMALQAEMDALEAVSSERFDLLQRTRSSVAAQTNDFYLRSKTLKAHLANQVEAEAAAKVKWQLTSQPEPWLENNREADRAIGLQRGIELKEPGFFNLPEGEQEYALGKAAKAGIAYANVLLDAAGNWSEMERASGKYDFSNLDRMISRFAQYNLRVCPMLRTLTGSPPRWHIDTYSTRCQFSRTVEDEEGNPKREVDGINLFHAPTGEAFGRFLTAWASHLKQNWSEQVGAVFIEGGQREIEAPVDESEAMADYWRKWSGSDAPWRTPEAIWSGEEADEVAAVNAEICREAWLLDYIRQVREALKRGWAELRLQTMTVNDDFHRLHANTTGKSRDVYALSQLTDNPGTGSTSPASLQLLKSFGVGRWTWAWALHSGCGATPGACFGEALFHDISHITGGWFVGNFIRDNYPGSWYRYPDQQFGDFGIGSYIMAARRAQELAPVVLNTNTAAAEVAILWSQTTRRRDRSWQLFQSALAWGHLLTRISVPFDYLPEDGLAERLKNYTVLILPNTQSMPEGICEVIRQWVQQGGILMGFGAPGLFDEFGNRRSSLPLAAVFGADVARLRVPAAIFPDKLETTHPEGAYTFGNPPPRQYKFETNLTAALKPESGEPRAWFAGEEKEVAIVEHDFGKGKALLCGLPVGFEYWETAPYELTYGLTLSRQTNYNLEQKRYEAWVVEELEKVGVKRELALPQGNFLRAQRGDDPDWFHVYRNAPKYSEYMFEEEQPVRTVTAYLRQRQGCDNRYVCLAHTEANYFWQRGYFRSMLSGAEVTISVASESDGEAPVVFDARLAVPVPSTLQDDRVHFQTWLPMAQSAAFAVAPNGHIRLFGEGQPSGIGPDALAHITAEYADATELAEVEILERDTIGAFLNQLQGADIAIGCGDNRFKPVAETLAAWLKTAYGVNSHITTVGPRVSCRYDYMDSFGWPQYGVDPIQAAILVGNCQDNGLMWKFLKCHGEICWLPLEINQDFPGIGRAVVMLSSPVVTDANGNTSRTDGERQLVIGASFPSEARRAVQELRKLKS